jgi:hypothetical protein
MIGTLFTPLCTPYAASARRRRRGPSVPGIRGADDADSVGLEGGSGSRDAVIVRHDCEPMAERPLEVRIVLSIQGRLK